MAKFKLLLIDAVIIIYLFETGLWEQVLDECEIHVSETIMGEAHFYRDVDGEIHSIHLDQYRERITVHDVPASRLAALRSELKGDMLDRMDPGEGELLCVLCDADMPLEADEGYRICSADKIVYRYLGARTMRDRGISLEEILTKIGRGRTLKPQYTKAFREQHTRAGFAEGQQGQAFR